MITVNSTLLIIILAVLVLTAAVVYLVYRRRKTAKLRREKFQMHNLAGHSEVLDSHDIKKRRTTGSSALVLGELIDPDRPEKDSGVQVLDDRVEASFFVGPPGSGKTKTLISPNIIRHNGPVFASTTKGDIIQDTYLARRTKGDEVSIFDPGGELFQSHHPVLEQARADIKIWTPLNEAVTWDRAEEVAEAMVTAVSSQSTKGGNEFFATQSKNVVAALLVLMRSQPQKSLEDVVDYALNLSQQTTSTADTDDDEDPNAAQDAWDQIHQDFIQQMESTDRKLNMIIQEEKTHQAQQPGDSATNEQRQQHAEQAQRQAQNRQMLQQRLDALRMAHFSFQPARGAAQASETRAGIVGSIALLTKGWMKAPAVLAQNWDGDTSFRIEELPDQQCSVFMTCPSESHRPLANAFLGAYMKEQHRRALRQGGALEHRHLVVLDELVYCTPHSELRSWVNNIARSANMKLILGTQSYADLEITWDEAQARALFNACKGSKALLPGATDSKLLDEFTKLAGKKNIVQVSSIAETTGKSANYTALGLKKSEGVNRSTSESVTRSVVERDTASPARLAAMPADTALLWLPGQPGIPGGTVQSRPEPVYKQGTDLYLASQGDRDAVARLAEPPRTSGHAINQENPLQKLVPRRKPAKTQGLGKQQ